MDAYRNDLASARKRIDELETALSEAQSEIARLKAPPPRRPDLPLERKLGFAIGLCAMLVAALGAQLTGPSERPRTIVAASFPKVMTPPMPTPPLDVDALDLEREPSRALRPEDERQLADPIQLPRLMALGVSDTEEALYEETPNEEGADPFRPAPAVEAYPSYLLGRAAHLAREDEAALQHLIEAVARGGSPRPNPPWLRDAYLLIARSAQRLGRHRLVAQAYRQAYAL